MASAGHRPMYDSLRKFLQRFELDFESINVSEQVRTEWEEFGAQLGQMTTDAQLINKLKDSPDELRELFQQKF